MHVDQFRNEFIRKMKMLSYDTIPKTRCGVENLYVVQAEAIVCGTGDDQIVDVVIWFRCSKCGAAYAHGIGDNFNLKDPENKDNHCGNNPRSGVDKEDGEK